MNFVPLTPILLLITAIILRVLIWFFSKKEIVRSNLNRHNVSQISDCKDHEVVCVKGEIIGCQNLLTAPLSETSCVFYNSKIEEMKYGATGKVMWNLLVDYIPRTSLIIYDGTGYAVVRTLSAIADIGFHGEMIINSVNDNSPGLSWLLNESSVSLTTASGKSKVLRCNEGVLYEGEEIKIKGLGIWIDTKELELDYPVDKMLVFEADPNCRLYIGLP
ncbi:MAG: hypothetical protein IM638_00105 [Bacteroidetes bacterium]|nr:hypothetical protein [Bacteroidota bacterium]